MQEPERDPILIEIHDTVGIGGMIRLLDQTAVALKPGWRKSYASRLILRATENLGLAQSV
jgi:hypothetical protein